MDGYNSEDIAELDYEEFEDTKEQIENDLEEDYEDIHREPSKHKVDIEDLINEQNIIDLDKRLINLKKTDTENEGMFKIKVHIANLMLKKNVTKKSGHSYTLYEIYNKSAQLRNVLYYDLIYDEAVDTELISIYQQCFE